MVLKINDTSMIAAQGSTLRQGPVLSARPEERINILEGDSLMTIPRLSEEVATIDTPPQGIRLIQGDIQRRTQASLRTIPLKKPSVPSPEADFQKIQVLEALTTNPRVRFEKIMNASERQHRFYEMKEHNARALFRDFEAITNNLLHSLEVKFSTVIGEAEHFLARNDFEKCAYVKQLLQGREENELLELFWNTECVDLLLTTAATLAETFLAQQELTEAEKSVFRLLPNYPVMKQDKKIPLYFEYLETLSEEDLTAYRPHIYYFVAAKNKSLMSLSPFQLNSAFRLYLTEKGHTELIEKIDTSTTLFEEIFNELEMIREVLVNGKSMEATIRQRQLEQDALYISFSQELDALAWQIGEEIKASIELPAHPSIEESSPSRNVVINFVPPEPSPRKRQDTPPSTATIVPLFPLEESKPELPVFQMAPPIGYTTSFLNELAPPQEHGFETQMGLPQVSVVSPESLLDGGEIEGDVMAVETHSYVSGEGLFDFDEDILSIEESYIYHAPPENLSAVPAPSLKPQELRRFFKEGTLTCAPHQQVSQVIETYLWEKAEQEKMATREVQDEIKRFITSLREGIDYGVNRLKQEVCTVVLSDACLRSARQLIKLPGIRSFFEEVQQMNLQANPAQIVRAQRNQEFIERGRFTLTPHMTVQEGIRTQLEIHFNESQLYSTRRREFIQKAVEKLKEGTHYTFDPYSKVVRCVPSLIKDTVRYIEKRMSVEADREKKENFYNRIDREAQIKAHGLKEYQFPPHLLDGTLSEAQESRVPVRPHGSFTGYKGSKNAEEQRKKRKAKKEKENVSFFKSPASWLTQKIANLF